MRLGIAALLCLVTLPAYGQAFGTHAGMKAGEFSYAHKLPQDVESFAVNPPQPHPDIRVYTGLIGPNIGLCKIRGVGWYPQQSSKKIGALADALIAIYGPFEQYSQKAKRWPMPNMIVTLIDYQDDYFELSYTFRDPDECEADALAAATSSTGL